VAQCSLRRSKLFSGKTKAKPSRGCARPTAFRFTRNPRSQGVARCSPFCEQECDGDGSPSSRRHFWCKSTPFEQTGTEGSRTVAAHLIKALLQCCNTSNKRWPVTRYLSKRLPAIPRDRLSRVFTVHRINVAIMPVSRQTMKWTCVSFYVHNERGRH